MDVDLTGIKRVTLEVLATGFGIRGDHADWLDSQFKMLAGSPVPEPVPIESAKILTPKPGLRPRFTGPSVFGVRPGNPILFSLTATGQRPMEFAATGLPKGVVLNSATGDLTGHVSVPGEMTIRVVAKNARGSATRDLKLIVGERISLTPPMGWNSWNSWGWLVTQEQVASSATMMANSLRDHGWTYVNIDDTWQGKRGGPLNSIQPNKKFPDMKGLVDKIHALGLKAGIYSTPWMTSYAGHIGGSADNSEGTHPWMAQADENQQTSQAGQFQRFGKFSFAAADAQQFAEWGFDYL
jgi:alpha-galactosidase